MSKFRKQPIPIDAVQWTGHNADEIRDFLRSDLVSIHDRGTISVRSSEGTVRGEIGHWAMRGVKGEHYLCAPDVFAQSYVPVSESVYDTPDVLSRDLTTLANRVAESTTRPAADQLVQILMDFATRAALLPVAVVQQPDEPIWDARNSIEPAAEPPRVDESYGMPPAAAPVVPASANLGLIE